jgi:signal transduction histidine kinase
VARESGASEYEDAAVAALATRNQVAVRPAATAAAMRASRKFQRTSGNRAGDVALVLAVFSLVPWLVGQALRCERRRSTELVELAAQLDAEREQQAREAVAAEGGHIARELHHIVAHAISVIAVRPDAAATLLDRDPGWFTRAPTRPAAEEPPPGSCT